MAQREVKRNLPYETPDCIFCTLNTKDVLTSSVDLYSNDIENWASEESLRGGI